jgi:hypothetical protein
MTSVSEISLAKSMHYVESMMTFVYLLENKI